MKTKASHNSWLTIPSTPIGGLATNSQNNMENEIQTVHSELSMTDVQTRIDDMIANRKHMIDKVRPLLIEGTDYYRLPGMKKDSLGKPGAEKLASFYALRAAFKIDSETMEALGDMEDKKYVAYVC